MISKWNKYPKAFGNHKHQAIFTNQLQLYPAPGLASSHAHNQKLETCRPLWGVYAFGKEVNYHCQRKLVILIKHNN